MRSLRLIVILMVLLALSLPALAQDAMPISIGDTVTGELTEGQLEASYTFNGEAGQVVVITLMSDDFDAFLRLLDPDGSEIETDDDSAGSLNSRIGPFEIPANGEYTIIASSLGASSPGAFTLALDTVSRRSIEYGQTIEGELTASETAAVFMFNGSAGDTITISLNSEDFDSFLRLALTNDATFDLITDDDGGGNLNSLIGPFTLPETASYTITASSLSGSDAGSFTLTLQRAEVTPIAFGETIEAEISKTGDTFFSFEGQAGQAVNIAVDSGDAIDTTLTLRSPQGWQIAYDDDSGGNIDPLINFAVLDNDGTYLVIVRPYSPGTTGSFSITLTESEINSLDDGPQTITLNDKQNSTLVQFSGEAGTTMRVSFELVSGTTVPSTIELTQNGTTISYISTSSLSGLSFDVMIPDTGTVSMRLESWDYEGITFTVAVSPVAME